MTRLNYVSMLVYPLLVILLMVRAAKRGKPFWKIYPIEGYLDGSSKPMADAIMGLSVVGLIIAVIELYKLDPSE